MALEQQREAAPIVSVEVYRVSLPLVEPYRLAFGTFDAFDTLLVKVQTEDGRSSWGEATACPGYVPETGDEIWAFLHVHTPAAIGSTPAEHIDRLTPFANKYPFASSSLLTALEGLTRDVAIASSLQRTEPTIVPLVGILGGKDLKGLEASFWSQVERGHRTVKLKVGINVKDDIDRTALVQGLARQVSGVRIRIDANQGYSLEDALRFVGRLDPEVVELFEQPFATGDWGSQLALAPSSPVPLMLDESIHGIEDIERAASQRCIDYVKFKLVKSGSFGLLSEQVAMARRLGLKVVLGNGVAGEIGCYQEALAYLNMGLEAAGEMNGYLKIGRSLLTEPLESEGGGLVVVPGFNPLPSPDRLEEMAVGRQRWP